MQSRAFIKNIKVSNFKSFDKIDIELGKFTVVIGANASGKSNFISIFRFLKDVNQYGLDNAVSMQGGVDYFRNVTLGASKDFSLEWNASISLDPIGYPTTLKVDSKRKLCSFNIKELTYRFSLRFAKRGKGYKVNEENMVVSFEIFELEPRRKALVRTQRKVTEGKINVARDDKGRITYSIEPKESQIKISDLLPLLHSAKRMKLARKTPRELYFLDYELLLPISLILKNYLGAIAIYDIDPRLSKRSTLISGTTRLNSDGGNLAVVLKGILDNKRSRDRIYRLMKEILPFIKRLSIDKFADKSLITCVKEIYNEKKSLPASLISDGTINLTALLVALYFERTPLIIIEEPDRNIHPSLISKLIGMMKDVSEKVGKQIIITTHNPEVVKSTGIANLLLIYRKDNFSNITKPSKKKEVRDFLRNEIGVDELFVKNLLEE